LPLFLVVLVWVREPAWELYAMELEEDHGKQHNLAFVLAAIIVLIRGQVQLNDTSSINAKTAR